MTITSYRYALVEQTAPLVGHLVIISALQIPSRARAREWFRFGLGNPNLDKAVSTQNSVSRAELRSTNTACTSPPACDDSDLPPRSVF